MTDRSTTSLPRGGEPGFTNPFAVTRTIWGDTGIGDHACPNAYLARGCIAGRYELLEEIGRGGMGQVLRARDIELQREVAVKALLHPLDPESQARLIREARAMATLSHPNVLPVYDVGETHNGTFIAMELVHGQTLRQWLLDGPRSWSEILDKFIAAGEGLAAAHRKGLVHRDFKPGNAMIGDDGRVRVLDFGLARPLDVTKSNEVVADPDAPPSLANITETGLVMGTPAYMAPEQSDGRSADARSDQYSFCVALWEALYGQRPFLGYTLHGLQVAKRRGLVVPVTPVGPRNLQTVLLRGLSAEPDERFPSMEALLGLLRRRQRGRSPWFASTAVVMVMASLGVGVGLRFAPRPCEGVDNKLDAAWGEHHRAEIDAAFRVNEAPYVQATAFEVGRHLETYANDWREAYVDACEATHVHEQQSPEVLDLRMVCLERRRLELVALANIFEEVDGATTQRAVTAAYALPSLEPCRDVETLVARREALPRPDQAAEVLRLRGELAAVRGLENLGDYEAALSRAKHLFGEARAVGFGPLEARVRYRLAVSLSELGNYEAAKKEYDAAFVAATELGLDELAADVAISHVWLAIRSHEYDLAERQEAHARAQVERLGELGLGRGATLLRLQADIAKHHADYDRALQLYQEAFSIDQHLDVDDVSQGQALRRMARVIMRKGDLMQALEHFQRARELVVGVLGPEHPKAAISLLDISDVQRELGQSKQALVHVQLALEVFVASLRPEHPLIGDAHSRVGAIYLGMGRYRLAEASQRQALKIYEAVHGKDGPMLGGELSNLSLTLSGLGRYDEAIELLERARRLIANGYGPQHPMMFSTLGNIAQLHAKAGRPRIALEHFERAHEGLAAALGPDHPNAAIQLSSIGLVRSSLGDHEGAARAHAESLERLEPVLGKEHFDLSYPLQGLGRARLELGDPLSARAPLERAVALRERASMSPKLLAESRFALARALWSDPSERDRAIELATHARAELQDSSEPEASDTPGRVDAWFESVGYEP